jgi:hypothetical protein
MTVKSGGEPSDKNCTLNEIRRLQGIQITEHDSWLAFLAGQLMDHAATCPGRVVFIYCRYLL